jgi:hypothetical protein
MTTKKSTRTKQGGKVSAHLPKLSTPANVRRLFALVNDKTQTAAGLHLLAETLDEITPSPDPLSDWQLFRRLFTAGAQEVEQTRGQLYTR